jgi:Integrase core domain
MDRRMRGSFRMSRCLQRLPAPFSVALSETCAETRTPWNCRKRVLSPDLPHTRKFATDTRATAYWGAEFRIPCNVASLLNFAENWQFETHTDAGVENVNADVDDLIAAGVLRRVLAFTELKFSNSMIEAWWRALKHHWLFLHSLDSVTTVRRLVDFYVQEHNRVLPHSAFRGQTPDEMYFGTGDAVPADLTARAAAARQRRLEANRSAACGTCPSTEAAA